MYLPVFLHYCDYNIARRRGIDVGQQAMQAGLPALGGPPFRLRIRLIHTETGRLRSLTYNSVMPIDPDLPRCQWPGKTGTNTLMVEYHDTEWGVPVHDDRRHFEFLVLDAFQAGLSWSTVLNKRKNFREAFDNFDTQRIARYTRRKVETLLGNPGIIRNRLKVESAIGNARAFLELQERECSFDAFVWQFVTGRPRQNRWRTLK